MIFHPSSNQRRPFLPQLLIAGCLGLWLTAGTALIQAGWVPQVSPVIDPNASFRAVAAVSSNVVWVGGSGGVCLRTLNGGTTWERKAVPGAEKLDFRGVAAFDVRTAILMSAGLAEAGAARLFRTTDGGDTWTQVFQTTEPGAFLDGIAFWDARNGLVMGDPVGGKWFLLRTRDGGQTWERLPPARLPAMLPNEAAFAAGNSALVTQGTALAWLASGGGPRARVFRTADRGDTWEVVETPMPAGETAGIFGLRFRDARHGMGVGGDHKKEQQASPNVMVTDDGGLSWRAATPTDPPGLKETVMLTNDGAWLAVGPSGSSRSADGGLTWKVVDRQPFHAAAWAEGRGWAVGGKGQIAVWQP